MKKLAIVFGGLVVLIFLSLFSCHKCGPFPNMYKTIGLYWHIAIATYSEDSISWSARWATPNDSIIYNEFSIEIEPIKETYYAQSFDEIKFDFVSSAYACDPALPQTDERIDSMVIVSSKDFNVIHVAGEDLSDLFDIIPVDFVNGLYRERFDLKEYISTNPTVPWRMFLILKEPPDLVSDYEFLVKYYQEGIDSNYFEFLTDKVVIIK
ncbi:MAG: hypothetical protein KDC79_08990 [Cyclobacteriaceae bacterium]|nr:hypothetical protein [Cyclobacteriaceae bacterium]